MVHDQIPYFITVPRMWGGGVYHYSDVFIPTSVMIIYVYIYDKNTKMNPYVRMNIFKCSLMKIYTIYIRDFFFFFLLFLSI